MTQARTNWFTRLFGNRRPKAPDSLPREAELPRALSMSHAITTPTCTSSTPSLP